MSAALRFEHFIRLPLVHRLKAALLAFFRASEVGVWKEDPTQRDDGATVHFIRGNWDASDSPGVGGVYRVPGVARWAPQHGYVANTIPMLLSVAVEDSADGLLVRVVHQAFGRESEVAIREVCRSAVDAELKSLAKYLKQSYHLPVAPEVSPQPAADPSCLV
ncbi:MAG: hypothetical protein GX575_14860 [Candidatus Anammoximicrobium sp.]|nr:hypothetical protein [Candidatus Anammoximicrobium sp.]